MDAAFAFRGQQSTYVVTYKAVLSLYRRNPDAFFNRYITVDETWIHNDTTETNEQAFSYQIRTSLLGHKSILQT